MNVLVCQAIRDRRIVRLFYDGGTRDVEPHVHGVGKDGSELLRGYQVSGYSQSGEQFGWKMFKLDRIRAFSVTDRVFASPREGYVPDDPTMSIVHCRL